MRTATNHMNFEKNVVVTFLSDKFNQTEPRDYFINPNCFGDDLAKYLMAMLREKGVGVEEDGPDQEDFGWYLNFIHEGQSYSCVVIHQEELGCWICILEYNSGLLGSFFGKRKKPVPRSTAQMFDQILQGHPDVFREVKWTNFTDSD